MKYKIAQITVIGIICMFCIGYLFSCYDGKKYTIENAEDYVRKVCEMGNVPGMSIVVLDNGQEYYLNTGYADKNKKEPMTSAVRCELGSTIKAFTALGVLLLEQDGRLDREDSVKDYLPWFRPTYDEKEVNITIEHAAGYLVSNTNDLSIWMKAQMGILAMDMTEKIDRAIIESHLYPVDEGQHYFAGWNLYDTYFCHGGNNPNFSSQVIIGRTNKKGVFALANICGSAPAKAADGIYRMMQGETVEIGFWMDGNSLVDLLCVIGCLFEIYIMVLLFERRGRVKYAGTKVFFYLMTALIVLLVPYILHYNYFTLAVWFSPCLFIAIAGIEICFTEYIVSCICNHKKSDEG